MKVHDLGRRFQGEGSGLHGSGFRAQGLWFRVLGGNIVQSLGRSEFRD